MALLGGLITGKSRGCGVGSMTDTSLGNCESATAGAATPNNTIYGGAATRDVAKMSQLPATATFFPCNPLTRARMTLAASPNAMASMPLAGATMAIQTVAIWS